MNDTPESDEPATAPDETATAPDAAGPAAGDGNLAERYRSEFPIFDRVRYLNSNSLGALSRRSLEQRRQFEEDWNRRGARSWYGPWMEKLDEVREGFAETVGARARDVALMPSVSGALTAVAGALDLSERPRVVVTELDFPTLAYQFLGRRSRGVEVEIVESPDGIQVPTGAVAEAVDERTALLATSHVFFTTGAVQDPAELAGIAHEHGALFLLDAYQSQGQMPVDVEGWGVDLLVSGALKWLLGGPGVAFLYVRPELTEELEPTTLSWFGVSNQFEFDVRNPRLREDARRFEMGTPSVGAAFTAAGGLEIVREIGPGAIQERNAALAEALIERLRAAGFDLRVAPDPAARSALVLARHPRPEEAVEWLARRNVVVDARPGCVRFSPHFYNTEADLRAAVDALVEERERA